MIYGYSTMFDFCTRGSISIEWKTQAYKVAVLVTIPQLLCRTTVLLKKES